MKCIDETLSVEAANDRVAKFVLKDLSGKELDDFQLHLIECNYCNKRALAGLKVERILQMTAVDEVYDNLREAYDKKEWERVIELGNELDRLGATEAVYLREEKVNAAIFFIIEKMEDELGDFILKKEFKKALDCCKEAHEIAPNNIEPKINMGATYRLLGNLIESEKILLECELQEPQNSETLAELGLLYMSMDKFVEAETKFQKAYELDSCIDYALNLSLVYLELGKSLEAETMLEEIIEIDQDDEAFHNFLSIGRRGPYDPYVQAALAWAYYDNGKVEEAAETINKTLKLDPNNIEILQDIGKLYFRHAQFDRALTYYEKAMKIEPEAPHILNNIAFCYHQKGEIVKAIQYIEMAIKSAPNDFTINYNHKIIKNREKEKPRLYFYYPAIAKAA